MTKAEKLKKEVLSMYDVDDLKRIFRNRFDDQMFFNVGVALTGSNKADTQEDVNRLVFAGYEYLIDFDPLEAYTQAKARKAEARR